MPARTAEARLSTASGHSSRTAAMRRRRIPRSTVIGATKAKPAKHARMTGSGAPRVVLEVPARGRASLRDQGRDAAKYQRGRAVRNQSSTGPTELGGGYSD
jgi:hypothetical protein